jgi:uncharacterized membrane protein
VTTATPRRTTPWLLQVPAIRDVHAPDWWGRLPRWLSTAGILLVLIAVSAFVRTRFIDGQFWSDEAIALGVASHPLGAIPGILRHDGSAPLYYFVLHVWTSLFGSGENAAHVLSLLLGLSTIPLGMWAGWSLFGRRAGIYAAVMFAFSSFLTEYAQEAQAWELLALIALVATASFLHAFVFRRRGYLIAFSLSLALLMYTSFWAIFFWAGAIAALVVVYFAAEERSGLARDGALSFAAALILFAPWIPNLIFQIGHTTSPWHFGDFLGATFPSDLLGSDRVAATFAIAAAVALLPLCARGARRTPDARAAWAATCAISPASSPPTCGRETWSWSANPNRRP